MSGSVDKLHKSIKEISLYIRSRIPLIYVVTHEEKRFLKYIKNFCIKNERNVLEWTVTNGIFQDSGHFFHEINVIKDEKEPFAALEYIQKRINESKTEGAVLSKNLFILEDFYHFFINNDPQIIRKLRDIIDSAKGSMTNIIILSPVLVIPEDLNKEIVVVNFDLPNNEELKQLLDETENIIKTRYKDNIEYNLSEEDKNDFIKAAKGLTYEQASSAIRKAMVKDKVFDKDDIKIILEEKIQSIKKTGILEILPSLSSFENIGGLDNLKKWLFDRKFVFSEEARKRGAPIPKGLLLLGFPGCGKSLIARSLGSLLNFPVLKLDVGKVFQGVVGSSERNIRQAINLADALAPCILFVDEIEKGLSGTSSSNFSDAGTTLRVFQTLLTWMQDRESEVFMIATANDISQLLSTHPEFFRPGRFDAIFYIDLPNEKEREEIFKIHLNLHKCEILTEKDISSFNISNLIKLTNQYSGAEIEQIIKDAKILAISKNINVNQEILEQSIKDIIPLSERMGNNLLDFRSRVKEVARPASIVKEKKEKNINNINFNNLELKISKKPWYN